MKTYNEAQFNKKVLKVAAELKKVYAKELAALEAAEGAGWSGWGFNFEHDVIQASGENVYLDNAHEFDSWQVTEDTMQMFAVGADEIIKELYNRI